MFEVSVGSHVEFASNDAFHGFVHLSRLPHCDLTPDAAEIAWTNAVPAGLHTLSVPSNLEDAASTGIGLWLRSRLRPGDVLVDIGANVGAYTDLGAQLVGASGHVYAIEPAPDNVGVLRERFRTHANVTVVPAAVSDRPGMRPLFLDRRDGRRHSVAADNVGKAGGCALVEHITLDDTFGEPSCPAVFKIDAQGAEHHILRGAQRVLRAYRPMLVLELWPWGLANAGSTARHVLDTLRLADYDVSRLSAKGKLKPRRFIDAFLVEAGRWNSINIAALPTKTQ